MRNRLLTPLLAACVGVAIPAVVLAKGNPPDPCDEFKGATIAAFERSVRSTDARARVAAAFCIPERHLKRASLLEIGFRDSHPFVRRAAAARAAFVAPQLLTRFRKDEDPYVRFWSVLVSHDVGTFGDMLDLHRATAEAYAKIQATKDTVALHSFEGTPSTEPVDLDHRSRGRGWNRPWAPGTQKTGERRLFELIRVEVDWLAGSGDQRSILPLLSLLNGAFQPFRDNVVVALYDLVKLDPNTPKAREAVPTVVGLLRIPEMYPWTRRMMFELLTIWNAAEAIPTALELLDHPEGAVQAEAARLLGSLKVKGAVRPLVALLASTDYYPRHAAIEALAKLSPESIAPLVEALRSGDWNTVSGAAEGLALIGPAARDAVPLLLAIASKDGPNHCIGLRALAAIEPASPRTVDVFLTFVEGGGECLNWSITDFATKIKPVPQAMVDRLRLLLGSPEARRRKTAAVLLGALGSDAAPAVDDLLASLGNFRRTANFAYDGDYDASLGETHRSAVHALELIGRIDAKSRIALRRRRAARCNSSHSECEATRTAIARALENDR